MKYHGAQESDAHRRMKVLLERSLRADPRASDIHQEKTWRAAGRPTSYRRPDVQALYDGVRLAFEAQHKHDRFSMSWSVGVRFTAKTEPSDLVYRVSIPATAA